MLSIFLFFSKIRFLIKAVSPGTELIDETLAFSCGYQLEVADVEGGTGDDIINF